MDFTRGSLVPPRKRKAGPGSIVIGVNQEVSFLSLKGGIAGFSEIAAQQSIQQLLQQDLVSQVHSRELDANAITGDNISHNRLCPHSSAGHFKRQPEFRAHGRWIGRGNEQTSHT